MSEKITGLFLMAMGGFLLMFAVAGKKFELVFRVTPFLIGIVWFIFGAKTFRKSLINVTINTGDFLIIMLSIFTPFIILIFLELLGFLYGGIMIMIWVLFVAILIVKWESVLDILFPKIEKRPVHEKSEEMRRMLNPRLYSIQTQRKKERK